MASIGGLDVAYGARLQVVRTNVMCVSVNGTGVSGNGPKHVLNIYKEALKGSAIEPDFLWFYEKDDVDGSGYTQAAADALFDLDNSADGTADVTALEVDGLLRSITQVPIARNSAFADTTASNEAYGTPNTAHNTYDINGNLALQAVLNVSAFEMTNTTASVAAGVFDSDGDTDETEGLFPQRVEAKAFKSVYDNALAANAGAAGGGGALAAGTKYTHLAKGPFTMDLADVLAHIDTGMAATGITAATTSAYTASTTFSTIATAYDNTSSMISVTSLAKVV